MISKEEINRRAKMEGLRFEQIGRHVLASLLLLGLPVFGRP
jgi:hypothetical protein